MPAVSKKQQRFFGMVRAAQKGEGASSPEVAKVAASIKKKDAKDFASTKHKGLPEKKMKSFKEATYPQDFKGGSVAKKKTDVLTFAQHARIYRRHRTFYAIFLVFAVSVRAPSE